MDIGNIIIFVTGVAGFITANHIRGKKKKVEKPFVCPLKFDCETVVNSRYSSIMGIPLEYLGMLYYGLISLVYGLFMLYPEYQDMRFSYMVIGTSLFAFITSMALTAIQAFKIKTWCSLCLLSAGFCTVIFIVAIVWK